MDPMFAAHTFVGIAGHYGMSQRFFTAAPSHLPQEQTVEGLVDIFLEGIRNRHE